PSAAQNELAVLGEQNDSAARQARMNLARSTLGDVVDGRETGNLAAEFIEPAGGTGPSGGYAGLVAPAPRPSRGDEGNREKNEERQQLIRLRDGKRVDWLDEKEIVGKK